MASRYPVSSNDQEAPGLFYSTRTTSAISKGEEEALVSQAMKQFYTRLYDTRKAAIIEARTITSR